MRKYLSLVLGILIIGLSLTAFQKVEVVSASTSFPLGAPMFLMLTNQINGSICSGDSLYCSSASDLYQMRVDSGITYICPGDSLYCSSASDLYQMRVDSGITYICPGDSLYCSSASDLYQMRVDSGITYICLGDSLYCSSASDLYQMRVDSGITYICPGDSLYCSSASDLYQYAISISSSVTPNSSIPAAPTYSQVDLGSAYLANFYISAEKITAFEKKYSDAVLELIRNTPGDFQKILDTEKTKVPPTTPLVIEASAKSMQDACDKFNDYYKTEILDYSKQFLQSEYNNNVLTKGIQDTANVYQSTNDYFTQVTDLMQKQTDLCKLQVNEKKNLFLEYLKGLDTKTCLLNQTLNATDNKCYCSTGYLWSSIKSSCITATASCQESYGVNSYALAKNADGTYSCQCNAGYVWNDTQTSCIKNISTSVGSSNSTSETSVFTDIGALTLYRDSILALKSQNIISGYADGSFKPDNTINRAELLKIIIGAKYPVIDNLFSRSCFKDVPSDQWYTKYVCFAKGKNIIAGYSDGTFKPDQVVNYVEALKMLLETYGLVTQKTIPWYQGYVDLATSKSIHMQSIGLDNALKRGEMAELMVRTINSQTVNNF